MSLRKEKEWQFSRSLISVAKNSFLCVLTPRLRATANMSALAESRIALAPSHFPHWTTPHPPTAAYEKIFHSQMVKCEMILRNIRPFHSRMARQQLWPPIGFSLSFHIQRLYIFNIIQTSFRGFWHAAYFVRNWSAIQRGGQKIKRISYLEKGTTRFSQMSEIFYGPQNHVFKVGRFNNKPNRCGVQNRAGLCMWCGLSERGGKWKIHLK